MDDAQHPLVPSNSSSRAGEGREGTPPLDADGERSTPPAAGEEETEAAPPRCPSRQPRPITPETRAEIVALHAFYGQREIAKRVHLSRKIVRRVLSEEGHSAMPTSTARAASRKASKLAPFRAQIEELVQKGLTISRILREIRGDDPAKGYQGGRTALAQYVGALRAQIAAPSPKAKRRFETDRAVELQVDWSPYVIPIGGVPTRVHCLGCLLCYSRKLFVYFFPNERQTTLFEGLAMAFEYFDGVTQRVVVDRMAQAVLGTIGPQGRPLWNPRFREFARYYAFDPFACKVRDPNRKGKKEKSFRLVWDDLLKGTEPRSWEELNGEMRPRWLDGLPLVGNNRVHGTTGRVPNEAWLEERPLLTRLPESRFPAHEDEVRVVDADSTLSVAGTRYTVPSQLANSSVPVRLFALHFEVLDRGGHVVFTRPYAQGREKKRLQIDPSHYPPLRRGRDRQAGSSRGEDAFVQRFPTLAPLAAGIKLRMKTLAGIHFRALLRLVDRWGEEAFVAAATRVQEYGRFDATAVRRVLEHEHPLPAGDLDLPPLGNAAVTVLLGEVEPPSLDDYSYLDTAPSTHQDEPQQEREHAHDVDVGPADDHEEDADGPQ